MRSFSILFVLFFLLFYSMLSLGAFQTIKRIFLQKHKNHLKHIFWSYSLIIILTFVFLYIYPNHPRQATNYSFYLIFNDILIIDFLTKFLLAATYLSYFPFRKRRKAKIVLVGGVILSLGIVLVLLYGSFIGKQQIKINRIELKFPNLPEQFDNYSVLQFSDFHLGSFGKSTHLIQTAKDKIKEINPDIIFFTGDLVNNFSDETAGWEKIFLEINASDNSYSILGNHDYGNYTNWKDEKSKTENFNAIVSAHKNLGFRLLRNEHVVIKSGTDSIFLAGVENWGHPPFPQYADLEKALQNIPEDAFTILLSHDPAHWESQIKGREKIELTLSGHTHGLQWGLKTAGIPFSFSYFTRKNWGGLYEFNNSYLYVNTGFGSVGIPWRIDMPAELTVFKLKRVEIH